MPRPHAIGGALVVALALSLAQASAGSAAPSVACAAAKRADLGPAAQERAMICLINRERTKRDLAPVRSNPRLARSAAAKNRDMLRCGDFSHTACGRSFTTTFKQARYRGRSVGENIAWGTGRLGTPAAIHRAWMRSPGHRRNTLSPKWRDVGVDVRPRARFLGNAGAAVWTAQYGVR